MNASMPCVRRASTLGARLTLVLLLGSLVGCQSSGFNGTTPDPEATTPVLVTDPPLATFNETPHYSPGPRTDPPYGDCIDWNWQVTDFAGKEQLAVASYAVATGTFEGYGQGYWNTPDHEQPTRAFVDEAKFHVTIVRDVTIDVDSVLRGSIDDISSAYVNGGTTGCDRVRYSNMTDFVAGARYVFLLADPMPISILVGRSRVQNVWPVDSEGNATTDTGEMITLDQLREYLQDHPHPTALPSATATA